MIQELLNMVEGRKICTQGGLLLPDGSSPFSSSTPISSPSSSPSPMSSSSPPMEAQQNLKCPRCDSSNTKFCYYNNYNLTQPRHFCKTCRRYWTKGGALRNVPIGGGCRRGKPSPPFAAYRSVSSKAKTASPNALAQPSQDQELPPCPVLWASPYSSQLLALLRASQLQNPNPNPNSDVGTINEQNLSSDKLSQLAAGAYESLGRSQQQYDQQQHMMVGEAQNSGNQEFLQRLRSSPANYYNERLPPPPVMSSVASFSPATFATGSMVPNNGTGTIVKSLPLYGGDFGYWNPGYSTLVDLNAKNGTFS